MADILYHKLKYSSSLGELSVRAMDCEHFAVTLALEDDPKHQKITF